MPETSLTQTQSSTPGMTSMIDQRTLDPMQVVKLQPSPDNPEPLPDSMAILIDAVQIGMTRLELMMKASRKGFNPVWQAGMTPYDGILMLYFNDKTWQLICRLQPVSLH